MRCCYCKKRIRSREAPFCVPEDYARNSEHDMKPLCHACGSKETPTLDEICKRLDLEMELIKK